MAPYSHVLVGHHISIHGHSLWMFMGSMFGDHRNQITAYISSLFHLFSRVTNFQLLHQHCISILVKISACYIYLFHRNKQQVLLPDLPHTFLALCLFNWWTAFLFSPFISGVCVHTCMHAHFVLLVLLGRSRLFCTCAFNASNLNIKSNASVGQLHAIISVTAVNRRPKCVRGYLWNYWDPVHHCAGDRPGYLGVVCIQEPSYIFRTVTHQGESTLWPCLYQNMFIET